MSGELERLRASRTLSTVPFRDSEAPVLPELQNHTFTPRSPGRQPAGGAARAAGQGEKGAVRAPAACGGQSRGARDHSPSGEQVEQGAVLRHGAVLPRQAPLLCGHGRDPPAPRGRGLARPPSACIGSPDGGGRAELGASSPEGPLGGGLVGLGPLHAKLHPRFVGCGPPADDACSCGLNPGVFMLVRSQCCWEKFCSNRLAQ